MSLSADLISKFVKLTNDNKPTNTETTVYATVVEQDNALYVRLDGPDEDNASLIAITNNTSSELTHGNRVLVTIKNHTAIVTANLSAPALQYTDARNKALSDVVSVDEIRADLAILDTAVANHISASDASFNELRSTHASFEEATIEEFIAQRADIDALTANTLTADEIEANYAKLTALDSYVLKATHSEMIDAAIENLDTKYATIDFSNIDKAAMEYFYATSGLISNVIVGDGTITGELVGVTIKGDLIEGGTVVADKLVIKGEDGLYYKLNTDGVTTEAEQNEYNSIHGSVILAQSITATKINVDDLVAFDATIGGFNITTEAIYSGVKESVDNTTSGVYLDHEGQFVLGDDDNFLRYYKDEEGAWRLEISAASVLFGSDLKSSAADIKALTDHVKIGTYEDPDTGETRPCVELSEGDINFKQVITNTSTMFMDGSEVRTEIDAEGITSENVTVKNEFRQGNFVWKVRSNGNMGLVWKGGSS